MISASGKNVIVLGKKAAKGAMTPKENEKTIVKVGKEKKTMRW